MCNNNFVVRDCQHLELTTPDHCITYLWQEEKENDTPLPKRIPEPSPERIPETRECFEGDRLSNVGEGPCAHCYTKIQQEWAKAEEERLRVVVENLVIQEAEMIEGETKEEMEQVGAGLDHVEELTEEGLAVELVRNNSVLMLCDAILRSEERIEDQSAMDLG